MGWIVSAIYSQSRYVSTPDFQAWVDGVPTLVRNGGRSVKMVKIRAIIDTGARESGIPTPVTLVQRRVGLHG